MLERSCLLATYLDMAGLAATQSTPEVSVSGSSMPESSPSPSRSDSYSFLAESADSASDTEQLQRRSESTTEFSTHHPRVGCHNQPANQKGVSEFGKCKSGSQRSERNAEMLEKAM